MEPNPNKKTSLPKSDQTARKMEDDLSDTKYDQAENMERQTSNKSGKHSSVEKLTASRPEFDAAPGAKPVPGAFGSDEPREDDPPPSSAHRDKALRPD
jgi:hypothetical protein